ncbi:efflux RND transporter periplasmic adaptor subunit [Cupriavidus respiraculi]|uniref:efflux RND transporter periplasmic adaptor subunit n=1 Tax=Cupriavidus respiraculi TaxID=195930 RepID=UPI001C980D6F|nr:efflux RND transporter periplasmic adaptor subunit [Cupriavidus respiraculi]MBY4949492.1 efflux RND transporter periplasmic adaptor subunit [Cupriavidus respiraculi]
MTTSKKQRTAIAAIILAGVLGIAAVLLTGRTTGHDEGGHGHAEHSEAKEHDDSEHHGHAAEKGHADADEHADEEHHEAPTKGPHGGNLYTQGDNAIELALAEEGGAARLRAWVSKDGKPVLAGTSMSGELKRATGESIPLKFKLGRDFLESDVDIEEPHVFDATVSAVLPGEKNAIVARLSREEGKIELTAEQIKTAAIAIEVAAPATVQSGQQFPGEIRFNEDRTAHVVPRLAGVVEAVPANIGQQVRKGQVLAVIASTTLAEQRSQLLAAQKRLELARTIYEREKKLWEEKISAEQDYLQARTELQEAQIAVQNAQQKLTAIGASGASKGLNQFELRAPFDGIIVEKHLALGEAVKEDANIFTISDLSTVWAEFVVSAKDLSHVRVGEKVTISSTAFDGKAEGRVSYVGSLLGEQTRTAKARVTLVNPNMAWRPGLFVTVNVLGEDVQVPVSVSADAVQEVDGQSTVFIAVPGGFVAQPVKIGRTNGKLVEVLEGLKPGVRYAAANSFILKSELGKASAEHTH